MAEKKNIPAIRFKGFSEEWEVHELLSGSNKIGDGLHGTPKYIDNGGVFFINGNNLFSGKISITDETKQVSIHEQSKDDKALDTNTILMSINGTIGNLAYYQGEEVMLGKSVAYILLSNFNKAYIYFYLQTTRVLNHFNNSLTGSTIKNLSLKTIRETDVFIPKNKTEQTKIGSYFQNLDKLISLHQAKVNKLVNLKKAMLEKMFPKQGADVPEIRFKGFAGAWEEIPFSSLVTRISSICEKTEYPRVEYEDIISGAGKLNKNIFQKESLKIGIEFDFGDILFGKLRPYLKNWLLPNFRGIAVGDFWVLRAKESDNKFIYTLIQTLAYEKVSNQSTGTKMPRSDWSLVSKKEFNVPSCNIEQRKIGSFFQSLDKLITLHQSELDKLNHLKKACLEKMFV